MITLFGHSKSLEDIFFRVDGLPKVIVIDSDLALINAVESVFLEASSLLCQFHIKKM